MIKKPTFKELCKANLINLIAKLLGLSIMSIICFLALGILWLLDKFLF